MLLRVSAFLFALFCAIASAGSYLVLAMGGVPYGQSGQMRYVLTFVFLILAIASLAWLAAYSTKGVSTAAVFFRFVLLTLLAAVLTIGFYAIVTRGAIFKAT